MSKTREQLENWLGKVKVNADVVYDIGGKQKSIKKRVAKWEAKEYRVLDLPEWDLNMDWEIQWSEAYEKANVVFCIEVSEYLFNPICALTNINKILKQNGILYMSFHFIYPIHKPEKTDFLRYTPDGVRKILTETGFMDIEITDRLSNIDLKQIYRAEGMHTMDINNNIIGTLIKCRKI